jgi:restriction system protein
METRFSNVTVSHSARGFPTYSVEAFHDGLHKYSLIRAADQSVLLNRAQAMALQWNAAWNKQVEAENRIKRTYETKEARRLHLENQKDRAAERTGDAQQILDALRNTLTRGIETDPTIDWEELKIETPFPTKSPLKPIYPGESTPPEMPRAPDPSDYKYRPRFSFIDRLITSRKAAKLADIGTQYNSDVRDWENACSALAAQHQTAIVTHREVCRKLDEQYAIATSQWTEERQRHHEELARQNQEIDQLRDRYLSKSSDAVIDYCERVLSRSDYPSCVPREFDFELNSDTGMLLMNSKLPAPADLPLLAEVKYVQTSDTIKEVFLSESQSAKLYDDLIYQIVLRTIHELFQSDSAKAISTIVFNGIVTSTDRSTGNEVTACILSIQASREPFLAINLAKVDPKSCFRQLKGVGSSKLHSVTPVAPIVELSREDRRFVPSYAVAEQLNAGYNLAVMDWEDFEHLIREIFQKEFSSGGGEVKVTQASRDGGVDAIAFDPDPIRGGKIVIQAKRYAYTVGVSAVRDLYGTVMNEGASKGILVTTSDYGPDAYEFANGKPLTLLSGSNLLHLLAKHGIGAHINLSEARKIAQERSAKSGG